MPGIFRPSHLIPSAYAKLVPDSEDSSEIEGFSSDDETENSEAAESGGDDDRTDNPNRSEDTHDDRIDNPNQSEDTRSGHPTGTRSTMRKRSSSSQTTSNR